MTTKAVSTFLESWFGDQEKQALAQAGLGQLFPPLSASLFCSEPVETPSPRSPRSPSVSPLSALGFTLDQVKSQVLTEAECELLWTQVCTPDVPFQDITISYTKVAALRKALDPRFHPYLTARLFLRLPKNEKGEMIGLSWMHYVLKTNAVKATIALLIQSSTDGFRLTKQDFTGFMMQHLASEPSEVSDVGSDIDSPTSPADAGDQPLTLQQLEQLAEVGAAHLLQVLALPTFPVPLKTLVHDAVILEISEHNGWFSKAQARALYAAFTQLDTTHSHSLSRTDTARLCNGVLTDKFLDAVGAPLSWPQFAAFQMAASNVHHPAAIRFLFRVLDVDKVGYLSEHAVKEYVTEVLNAAKLIGAGGGFEVKDIVNEVFDMARADQTQRIITLKDLLKCGVGGTIIRILVDVHGLSQYDQFLSSGG